MQEGTVKFFNNTKGIGLITSTKSGKDITVNTSGLIDEIKTNDNVHFQIEQNNEGDIATQVEILNHLFI